jgi:hypothetical protein
MARNWQCQQSLRKFLPQPASRAPRVLPASPALTRSLP